MRKILLFIAVLFTTPVFSQIEASSLVRWYSNGEYSSSVHEFGYDFGWMLKHNGGNSYDIMVLFPQDIGFGTIQNSPYGVQEEGHNYWLWATFLTVEELENLGVLYEEVDGSITNEIELPTVSGQNGKYLSTNGSTVFWQTADPSSTNEIELPDQTGNAGEYLTTNGTTPSWAAVKRQEIYSGSTNSSGNYTVTFSQNFSVAPNIQAVIIGGSNTNILKVASVSTSGFTIHVANRVDVLGLLPSYTNVNGASVDVLVTEK